MSSTTYPYILAHSTYIAPPEQSSITRNYFAGAVQSDGNSCYISVVLQELARFPEVYDQALYSHRLESDKGELQQHLQNIVLNIRSGTLTQASDIVRFRKLLRKNGCYESIFDKIRVVLNRVFPALFTPPPGSPFRLYTFILQTLGIPAHSVIIIDDDPKKLPEGSYSVDARLKEVNESKELNNAPLCRVRLPLGRDYKFSESITTKTHRYSLQQIHYSYAPGHIATAIKRRNRNWVRLDDANVSIECKPPPQEAVLLIYRRCVL